MSAYPRMIFHADGRTHVLLTADSPQPEGDWSDQPHDVHREAQSDHMVTKHYVDEALAHRIADIVIDRLRAETSPDQTPPKRGPGRPRKSETEGSDND